MDNKEKKDLRHLLEIILDKQVDSMFELAHDIAKTESGDITPAQQAELDGLKDGLLDLIMSQTLQNVSLPPTLPKEEGLSEFSVTVCRTASACREILIVAHSEEEAKAMAEDEAGDHEYSEKEADYTIEDVTKIGDIK